MAKVVIPVTADVKEAQKEIEKIETQKERLSARKVKLELDEQKIMLDLQKIDNDIEALQEKMNQKRTSSINLESDSGYQSMVRQMEVLTQTGELYANRLEVVKAEANQTTQEYDKQVQKQQQLGVQLENNKGKQQQINNSTREHSFHLGDILKKVSRWGLAIIGVRSAYMGIRRAISLVASSNDEISQKMEQMRNVIANALSPIVEFVVNLLMKAMVYVNYITKTLFGKEIFNFSKATSTASKNMASTQKSAKGTAKALKQASKQLAGFDEMNVLSDNRDSGGGGTSGVGGVGGLDTSKVKNMFDDIGEIKIPKWLEKLTGWIKSAIDWLKQLDPVAQKVLGVAGIGGLLLGKGLLSGTGGTGLLGILGKTTLAVGTLEGAYWLANDALTALGLSTGTTGDLVTDLYNVTKDYFELQKQQKDIQKGQKEVTDKSAKSFDKLKKQLIENKKAGKEMNKEDYQTLRNLQDRIMYLGKLENPTKEQKEELKKLKDIYGDLYREGVLNNTQMEFYRVITGQTKVAVWDYSRVLDNLIDQQNEEWRASQNQADANEQVAQSTKDGKYWVDQYGVTLETVTKNAGLSKEQTEQLRDALNKFSKSDKGPSAMLEFVGTIKKLGQQAGLSDDEIRDLINSINGMKPKDVKINLKAPTKAEIEKLARDIAQKISNVTTGIGIYVNGKAQGHRKGALIKYASGGIVNQPGRGVPLAVGGEAGREGVIPLTDSQQMALLGEAIGKYITINANITNSMNGRIISRELQKIQNEENFASNRW